MVLGCHDGYTTLSSVASIVADARLIGLGLLTMMQEARLHLAGGRVTRSWSQARRIMKTIAMGLGFTCR